MRSRMMLMASPYRKTAKAYILYRKQHENIRDIVNTANIDLIGRYIEKTDWQVNENSNMGYSLQGLNNYVASEISKVYWLNKIYPKEIKEAQINGDFHIHDLNTLSVYCVGWDLADLLMSGFKGAEGKAESGSCKALQAARWAMLSTSSTRSRARRREPRHSPTSTRCLRHS